MDDLEIVYRQLLQNVVIVAWKQCTSSFIKVILVINHVC